MEQQTPIYTVIIKKTFKQLKWSCLNIVPKLTSSVRSLGKIIHKQAARVFTCMRLWALSRGMVSGFCCFSSSSCRGRVSWCSRKRSCSTMSDWQMNDSVKSTYKTYYKAPAIPQIYVPLYVYFLMPLKTFITKKKMNEFTLWTILWITLRPRQPLL